MHMRKPLAALIALVGLMLANAAWALPTSKPATVPEDAGPALVQKIHGCHFDMGPGMAPDHVNGPHYHNRQCAVIRVGPPGGQRHYQEAPRYRPPPPPPQQQYYPPPRNDGGYRGPRYDGGYGGRRYGGPPPPPMPACRQQCRYRGPFKTCKTVCG